MAAARGDQQLIAVEGGAVLQQDRNRAVVALPAAGGDGGTAADGIPVVSTISPCPRESPDPDGKH
jgi:hypothetical protein